jgi:hypothetical protein
MQIVRIHRQIGNLHWLLMTDGALHRLVPDPLGKLHWEEVPTDGLPARAMTLEIDSASHRMFVTCTDSTAIWEEQAPRVGTFAFSQGETTWTAIQGPMVGA